MKFERDDTKVGLLVLAALLIFGGMLFYRSLATLLQTEIPMKVRLDRVTDLAVGTEVQLQGLRVGRIKAIELKQEGVEYHFLVSMALRPGLSLWKGTRGVAVSKVFGSSYLELQLPEPQARKDPLPANSVLEGDTTATLAALIDHMQDLIQNLNGALTDVRGPLKARGLGTLLDHPDVKRTLGSLDGALQEARGLAQEGRAVLQRQDAALGRSFERLEASLAVLQGLLTRREGDLDTLVTNLATTTRELNALTLETRALLKGSGPEVEASLKALRRNLLATEELLELLKAKPNRLIWGTPSPEEREAARQKAEDAQKP